jgi:hypothetical protein
MAKFRDMEAKDGLFSSERCMVGKFGEMGSLV